MENHSTNFFCLMNSDTGKPCFVYTNKSYYDENMEELWKFAGLDIALPVRYNQEYTKELCNGETPIEVISNPMSVQNRCFIFVLNKKSYKKVFNIQRSSMTLMIVSPQ